MDKICFSLGMLMPFAGFVLCLLLAAHSWVVWKSYSKRIPILLGLVLTGAFFLCFACLLNQPYDAQTPDKYQDVLHTLFVTPRSLLSLLSGNGNDLMTIADGLPCFGNAYHYTFGTLAMILPPLAATALLSMLGGIREFFILLWIKTCHTRELHVFSELNDKTLLLADSILNNNGTDARAYFIFLRSEHSRSELPSSWTGIKRAFRYALFPGDEMAFFRFFLHFLPFGSRSSSRERMWHMYFMSKEASVNFSNANRLLFSSRPMAFHTLKGFEIYILAEEYSSELLADSLRVKMLDGKQRTIRFRSTDIHLLQPMRATTYALLNGKPFYQIPSKENAVLILGFDQFGQTMLRIMASDFVMLGGHTQFHIWDKDIHRRHAKLRTLYPDWQKEVDCHSEEVDVCSNQFHTLLRQFGDLFHYIVVTLGDDEISLQTAILLCQYYRQLFWQSRAENREMALPVICVRIRDKTKQDLLQSISEMEKWYKKLYVFGSTQDVYSQSVLLPRTAWEAARCLHKNLHSGTETYIWSEYERRSSLAAVYHCQRHIASIVQNQFQKMQLSKPFTEVQLYAYDEWMKEKTHVKPIAAIEHQRWETYVYCEGMRHANRKVTACIMKETGYHVDSFARLTPCLIELPSGSRDENNRPEQKFDLLDNLFEELYPDKKLNQASDRHPFKWRDCHVVTNAVYYYKLLCGVYPGELHSVLSDKDTTAISDV